MKKRLLIPAILLTTLQAVNLNAQVTTLPLWPNGIPGSIRDASYVEVSTVTDGVITRWIKVTDPSITVCLPAKEKATGTAVLICPGGGYGALAFGHEGNDIAKWLNDNGIAGIILKYRLPSDLIMKDKSVGPLQDAQEAMRTIRRNAKAWNINPRKIGVIGFSAGGHLASTEATHFKISLIENSRNTSLRPDFQILVYPVISMQDKLTHPDSRSKLLGQNPSKETMDQFSNELQADENTPPAYITHAADDKLVDVDNSIEYFEKLRHHNVPVEMHIYPKGGHGFIFKQEGWMTPIFKWIESSYSTK